LSTDGANGKAKRLRKMGDRCREEKRAVSQVPSQAVFGKNGPGGRAQNF